MAAESDGTIGAVAGQVINARTPLGMLPLGTHNDLARSLGIPLSIEDAVHVLTRGMIATIDGGLFVGQDGTRRYCVQAAAMGIADCAAA